MIYYIGTFIALLLIFFSIDDFFWEMYYLLLKLFKKNKEKKVEIKDLEKKVPKLIAIIIAAYNEESVLENVIENLVSSQQYPIGVYHIFIGVYPNDLKTKTIAEHLQKKYPHIHAITHVLDGPSSKADNINNVIKNIYAFEIKNNLEFQGIVIHDSEDIVHPYELLLVNYLFKSEDAIQIPVFPLQEMPKLKNIFKNMITGTYADEFAVNHLRSLPARSMTRAFVPSAGTGFAIRRNVLKSFKDENVFPVGSLTEDYKLSLQLKEKGFDLYYPLEKVIRINYLNNEVEEFIATRSMFPKTYKAAVRQKTRWIYGITMQSFKLKDIIKSENLNFQSKYTLYKDYKTKFSNLLILPVYLIFVYFVFSLFTNLSTIYTRGTFSWYLIVVLTFLMAQKQIMRFRSVYSVYGIKSAVLSSLIPPILPVRVVLANIINFHATFNAWKINCLGINKIKTSKKIKPKWSKTDHEFLSENILLRFKRNLGDELLKNELISPKNLNKALMQSKTSGKRLGELIVENKFVSEIDVIKSIAEVRNHQFIDKPLGCFPHRNKEKYNLNLMTSLNVLPLFETNQKLVLATTIDTNIEKIFETFEKKVEIVYCTKDIYNSSFNGEYSNTYSERNLYILEKLIDKSLINTTQAIVALRYTEDFGDVKDTLKLMGFL